MNNDEVKDIVPNLLKEIDKGFKERTKESKILKEKLDALKNDKATYKDANEFAIEVGNILSDAFKDNLSAGILPDNKMYYNIAKRLIDPNMTRNYDLVSEYSKEVQSILNKKANISIKAQKSEINQDRIDKIVDKISNYDDFEKGKWLLGEPVVNFTQSVVDDTVRKNADLHSKAGLSPKIERYTNGKCCDWCDKLAGIYNYEDVKNTGNDVFRRHRHCRCRVDYVPDKSKRQNVWSKKWTDVDNNDKIKERIELSNKIVDNKLNNIARSKAIELGYNPLPDDKVVNTLRKDAKKWIQTLSDDEVKAINKYTFNGKDEDGLRLFEKINGFLDGRYKPFNDKEKEIILRNTTNINKGLLKNKLKHDIIVYRKDHYPKLLEGSNKKFLSTSVTKKGVIKGSPNVAIIVPKGTRGSYVESLSEYKKQREYLLNIDTDLEKLFDDNGNYIYIVRDYENKK